MSAVFAQRGILFQKAVGDLFNDFLLKIADPALELHVTEVIGSPARCTVVVEGVHPDHTGSFSIDHTGHLESYIGFVGLDWITLDR